MWIDQDYLYVVITGRCATVTKTKLGAEQFREYVSLSFIFEVTLNVIS